ncbi:MAG: histidine--tRNA ligase [Clostridia bacterium]|nr:histidine--tRNA ligase [Clostridia bacterium]
MQKTKAKTLAGFLELEPRKQIVFDNMKEKIKSVFELNGLSPMDTPILEYSEVLLAKAGGETEKQIYRFTKGENDICMRFDLTVPFAKYSAKFENQLIFPFKRYQIGKVFRGERAQKGRLREFFQCDMDIIDEGELSICADAECVSVLSQVFETLDYFIKIRISNRKLLGGMLDFFCLKEQTTEILNILDKQDKIGTEKTLEELLKITDKAKEILQLTAVNTVEKLEKVKINNTEFNQGVAEIKQLFEILKILKPKNEVVLDLKVIRGLDYYTGTIFEANLLGLGEPISVSAGGRYDNLAENYSNKKLAGVGVSIGLSRLFDILDKNNLLQYKTNTKSQVTIIPLGNTTNFCFDISKTLKENKINCDVLYFDKSFKSKLNYANRKKVPYIIVVGEEEIKNKTFGLKDMETGFVVEDKLENLIKVLRNKNE